MYTFTPVTILVGDCTNVLKQDLEEDIIIWQSIEPPLKIMIKEEQSFMLNSIYFEGEIWEA